MTDTVTRRQVRRDGSVSHGVVAAALGRDHDSANAFINRYSTLMGYPNPGSGHHRRFKESDIVIFVALSDASKLMPSGFPNEWVPPIVDQLRESGRAVLVHESDGVKMTLTVELP